MADSASIDTSKEIKAVEDFGKSLDKVTQNMRNLNATSLSKLHEELDKLKGVKSVGFQIQTGKIRTSLQELEGMLTASGKGVASSWQTVAKSYTTGLTTMFSNLRQLHGTYVKETLVASQKAAEDEKKASLGSLASLIQQRSAMLKAETAANIRRDQEAALQAVVRKAEALEAIKKQLLSSKSLGKLNTMNGPVSADVLGEYTPYNALTAKALAEKNSTAPRVLAAENKRILAEQERSTIQLVASMRKNSKAILEQEAADARDFVTAKLKSLNERLQVIHKERDTLEKATAKNLAAHAKTYEANLTRDNRTTLLEGAARSKYFTKGTVDINLFDLEKNASVAKAPSLLGKFGSALKSLSGDMGDTHSAARGLASGMNLLWLTWGNLVPLAGGAAVSFGLRAIVEQGAKVQDTLLSIKTLAGGTIGEVAALNAQMLELARSGPFGPQEIAEAMKTLSLAGLDAKDVYSAMPELLNFAVAGSTNVTQAAEALTTIGTAFNITAQNYGHISDVVSKAAADSKSSVESMSSAFKTASVIHQQYGVSLIDTAVGLSLLANAGIQGTAAGTALRNMYADLSGRTPKVSAALKKLGVDVTETNGAMRDQGRIFSDLMTGLDKYTGEDKIGILNTIFSERGGKEAIAIINSLDGVIRESQGSITSYTAAYDKLKESIQNSEGFSIIAAAEQGLSPLNQMKEVASSLSAAFVAAFNEMQPYVLSMAQSLQAMFNSADFRNGIKDFATALGTILTKLIEFSSILVPLGAGLVAVDFAFGALAGGAVVYTAATASAATATTVLTAAMRANPVGILVSGILAAGAAWFAYKTSVTDAKAANDGFTGSSFKEIGDRLQMEVTRLENVNKARREGISLMELEAETAMTTAETIANKGIDQAEASLSAAQKDRRALEDRAFSPFTDETALRVAADARVTAAQNEVAEARRDVARQKARNDYLMQELKFRRRDENTALPGPKPTPTGTETWEAANSMFGRGNRERTLTAAAAKDNLQAIQAAGAAELAALNDKYNTERQVLEAYHSAGLVSEGAYQAKLLDLITSSEVDRVDVIRKENEALDKEQDRWMDEAYKAYQYDVDHVAGTEAEKAELRQKYLNELVNAEETLNEKLIAAKTKNTTDISKIENDGYLRREKAAAEYGGKLLKIEKEQKEAAEKNARDKAHEDRLSSLELAYASVTEASMASMQAEKAAAFAAEDAQAKLTETLAKSTEQILLETAALEEFRILALLNGKENDEEFKTTLANMTKVVEKLKEGRAAAASKGAEGVANAASKAYQKVIDQDVARLQRGTADAIETALFEGGTAGKKKLRDLIVAELKKPIRMVIDAIVNPMVGSLLGSMGIGSAAGGSMLGSAASSIGGSALGSSLFGGTGVLASASGALSGFSTAVTAGAQTMVGLTGTTAQMTASLTAAGHAAAPGMAAGVSAGNAFMAAAPWIAGGLLVLNALGAFRTTKKVGGGLSGTLGSGDIESYDLNRKSGTLFSGPDYRIANRQKSAYSEMIQNDWKLATTAVVDMAKSLGLATDAASGFTAKLGTDIIHPDTGGTGIKLDDLNGKNLTAEQYDAEVRKRINDAILSGSEELAQKLIGSWKTTTETIKEQVQTGWDDGAVFETVERQIVKTEYVVSQYARSNETALQTLTRLSTSIVAFNSMSDTLGWNIKKTGLAGADAASAFIDLFGGLDKFNTTMGGYYVNYYTEAERTALTTKGLKEDFAELGKEMPGTRAGLRAMIDSAVAAGDTTLAAKLLKLQGRFADLVPSADAAAEALSAAMEKISAERENLDREYLQVTGNTAGLRALDLAELDASNRGIQEQIWAYQDQQAAQEAAAAAAQEAAQAAQQAAEAYANAFNDAQQFLDGLRNTITGWLAQQNAQAGGMQGYNSAAAAFSSQLVLARGGDRDALGGITSYANTLMDAIARESSTASEAALRAGRVRGQIAALPDQLRPEQLIANAIAQWGGNTVNAVASGAASQVAEIKALAAGYATALVPVVSGLSQGFAALDTNLSNALDFSEFAAALQGKATDAEIRRLFDMIDLDNDRLISASEATLAAAGTFGDQVAASLPRDFGKIDVNLSGGIDYSEFSSAFAGLATESTLQATFQSIDSNGDGVISQLEASVAATEALGIMITSSLATNFAKFDTSGNGTVDFSEFSGSLGGLASEATLRDLFNETDANGDGQISRLEAINANTTATAVDTSNNVVPTLRDINTGLGYHFGNLWYGLHTDLSAISGQLATGIKVSSLNQSSGNLVAFAQGGVFTNSIVSRPTLFNTGLMGEAGEEAIMPLHRGSDGSLGVAAQMPAWCQTRHTESNTELVSEIRALREENQAQARALVQVNQRMTKLLERWDGNGMPNVRVEA